MDGCPKEHGDCVKRGGPRRWVIGSAPIHCAADDVGSAAADQSSRRSFEESTFASGVAVLGTIPDSWGLQIRNGNAMRRDDGIASANETASGKLSESARPPLSCMNGSIRVQEEKETLWCRGR